MFPHLVGLGINEPTQIERYSLRQEAHKDVLKIYFKKQRASCSPKASSLNIQGRSKMYWSTAAVISTKKSLKLIAI